MPAAHYITDTSKALDMPSSQAKEYLTVNLLSLLDSAIDNLRKLSAAGDSSVPVKTALLSYNLVITTSWMMLVPRSKADYIFKDGGSPQDKLSLNALGSAFILDQIIF